MVVGDVGVINQFRICFIYFEGSNLSKILGFGSSEGTGCANASSTPVSPLSVPSASEATCTAKQRSAQSNGKPNATCYLCECYKIQQAFYFASCRATPKAQIDNPAQPSTLSDREPHEGRSTHRVPTRTWPAKNTCSLLDHPKNSSLYRPCLAS